MKYYLLALLLVALLVSCKKEEVPFYEGSAAVAFYVGQYDVDSLTYSFAFALEEKEQDTVYLNMRLQGALSDRDRVIKVKAGEGTTARENIDFILPEINLPANTFDVRYPVILFNTPEMKTQPFRLVAEIDNSKDLVAGASGTVADNSRSLRQYTFWVSNILSEPSYWSSIASFFGQFSAQRYRVMVDILQITDFSREVIGDYGVYNYPVRLRNAMPAYEAEHGEQYDEYGKIEF